MEEGILRQVIDDEVLEAKFGGRRENLDHAALHAREEDRHPDKL